MSKKKSSTMTLKDFHGGSIPSDLPLPSAPGVSVRPPDRWGPPGTGIRSVTDAHNRPRPGSAGGGGPRSGSAFPVAEERASAFLSSPAFMGRHFDEDERKPFDSSATAPRRSTPPPSSDSVSRPAPVPAVASSSDQKPRPRPAGPTANAWGLTRDLVPDSAPQQGVQTSSLSSRIAQASAVEKVTSGRWQTRLVDAEVAARFQDTMRLVDGGGASSTMQQEVSEVRPVSKEGRLGPSPDEPHLLQQQIVGVVDVEERPKLKLLPKTRPMDAAEVRVVDEKQVYQSPVEPVCMESHHGIQGSVNIPRPMSAGADAGGRLTDRPRLNLKPRSLPVEQSDEIGERKSVFGGARPRELVLKERGIDDIVAINIEVTSPANRGKGSDSPKTDAKYKLEPAGSHATRREKSDIFFAEQRSGRDFERKDSRPDTEKVENQRASRRNEKPPAERRLEPETWRKPVEEPKAEGPPGHRPRPGKAASALELAQAFSRSVSDSRPDNRLSPTQRRSVVPGRVQLPFSRLTVTRDFQPGPNPRQINGY